MPLPTAAELNNHVLLTHTTRILPKNGVMIPGIMPVQGTGDPDLPLPPSRVTLHWYPQGLIEQHDAWVGKDASYYIVEPAKHLKSKLYGGYVEDFMTIGRHVLSHEAIIYVPVNKMYEALQELLPGFKGRVIPYTSRKEVVESIERITSPNFHLHIPPNQQYIIERPLEDVIRLIDGREEPEFLPIRKIVEDACRKSPRPEKIPLALDVLPENLELLFNGEKLNARTFFSAWEKEGRYFGSHASTPFYELECLIEKLLKSAILPTLTASEIETTICDIENLAHKIKQTLIASKFPADVIDYYDQKITIDILENWIPELNDIMKNSKGSYDAVKARLIEMVANQTTILNVRQIKKEPLYESVPLAEQVTAQRLNDYGYFFSPYKRQGKTSYMVDAVSEHGTTEEKISIQKQLQSSGVFSYFSGSKLIVPDINTRMVADAIMDMRPTK